MTIYPADSVILAPLSGYTDLPYRHSARRHGCRMAFAEMVDAGSLAFGNKRTRTYLDRGSDEDWLGVQLVGCEAEHIAESARILNDYRFDVIDFNLGCPAPKVAKKGAGAVLGTNIDKAVKLFSIIAGISCVPVSAKIRILNETDPASTVEIVKKLESAGASAVTIHGRIKESFYSGQVFHDVIAAARQAVKIQVIANGGIMDVSSYDAIRQATGCECVMVARGAMGNPWIFEEIAMREQYQPPTIQELCAEIELHVLETIDYYGEELAMKVSRKLILDYMRGRGFPGGLKAEVSFLHKKEDFYSYLDKIRTEHTERYWHWLEKFPLAERRLRRA